VAQGLAAVPILSLAWHLGYGTRADMPSQDQQPMPSDAVTVDQPKHPLHALATFELRNYRKDLERAIKGIPPDAPVQSVLQRKLGAVIAEQEERARMARSPG
jgi:hypothetical protein